MSVVDDIQQAITASSKLDATAKGILSEFVQTAGPALANLAPAVVQNILTSVLAGDAGGATAPIAANLTEEQVIAVLGSEAQQMGAAADQHAAQAAATQQAVAALQNAAISILGKLLVSVL